MRRSLRKRYGRHGRGKGKPSAGSLFDRDTSGERFQLTAPTSDERDLPGMAEWRARQKRAEEAGRLRDTLALFDERRGRS